MRKEMIFGLITVITGFLSFIIPNRKTLLAAVVFSFIVTVLTILFPLKITGIYKMATMPCRLGALPGLMPTGIITALLSLAGLIAYRKENEDN